MSSLKELTEDATTDRQDIRSKVIAHLKTYTFFVFYESSSQQHPVMHRVQFKPKEEKMGGCVEGKSSEGSRLVQVQFYNIEQECERKQGLLDLKQGGLQSKSKIVAYCQEESLMDLVDSAKAIGLDLTNTPIILTYGHPHSDFPIFTGWNESKFEEISRMPMVELQQLSKRWIQSAQEKVDVWSVSIKLAEEGRVEKQVGRNYEPLECEGVFERKFLSHLSLGHHVKLSKRYNQRCQQPERKAINSFIRGWESFKNFCCLKASNMRSSTGVVNINYIDEKGEALEILKHLREYDGSEESELEASRVIRTDKGILSLLVTNIDRFQGNKISKEVNCKPGDGRVEIVVFEGVKKCRRLGSVGNEIVLKIESESGIDLQIGEAVYRCWGCSEIRISQGGRLRMCINKQMLEC